MKNMMRFLVSIAFLCALFPPLILSAADTKPNVILLVSDDQGWGDVGYHNSEVSTPNIDQLVKDGLEMDRFYVYPICSPTRTSLLTGHISMRHKVFWPMPGNLTLTHDEQLMNEAFKEAGYMTMTAGKWHLGHTHKRDFPINRGFDHTYGSLRAGLDYWTYTRGGQKDWARDGKTVFESGYMTDLFGNEISRLIRERDKSKPFFSYVAFTAPHIPLQAPQAIVDKYQHIEDLNTRLYYAMIEVLDTNIGNILKAVDEEGIRDNTLVLFFSDNGPTPAIGSNGGFRGRKDNLYEGGTRMPAVFRWPGKIPAGVKSEQPMVVYDLFPTLVDALNIPTRLNTPFDGESLWDVLQTGKTRARKTDMIIGTGITYSIHAGEYKLVHSNINKNTPNSPPELVELFKIYEDPYEKTNVASEYPDVVDTLIAKSEFVADLVKEAPIRQRRPGRGGLLGYDSDGDGIVHRDDVKKPDVASFDQNDTNHDSKLDSDEFAAMRAASIRVARGPAGGGPPPPQDKNGNVIHLHESIPSD